MAARRLRSKALGPVSRRSRARIATLIRRVFGLSALRPGQQSVIDAVLASLFFLVGIANFTVVDPVNILAGISALAVGACAAITACLFVAFGGWSAKDAYEAPNRRLPKRLRSR